MRRDSLYGEPVLWSGRPKEVSTPGIYVAAAVVCAVTSAIATASAFVVSTVLDKRPGELIFFAGWMATIALAFAFLPRWWRSELEFLLTDRHIVIRRGKIRRSIERRAISFARIHWHPRMPGIGDLELVRAVPTGALRRRLAIVLPGLVAPDRVWAIIRGVAPTAPAGDGHRLLAQRLDEGERVLWAAQPVLGWGAWIPTTFRQVISIGIACALGLAAVVTSFQAVHSLRVVIGPGLMKPESASFIALVASLSLTIVLLASASVGLLYAVVYKPARLHARTRYLITDRRVLIQRGDEELHLDRSGIVDVIHTPIDRRLHDIFLVLDGPSARAVAASGAFGEARGQGLQPVLLRVADADEVQRILLAPVAEAFPRAA